jgi:hypothetical protein
VVGLDVSTTGIRHTGVLKLNMDWETSVWSTAGRARRRWAAADRIVCTGVLHHLPDPEAGLRPA